MNTEEYIEQVLTGSCATGEVAENMEKEMRRRIKELMDEGRTEEKALAKYGHFEQTASALLAKYDVDIQNQREGVNAPPMLLAWAFMFSILLFIMKSVGLMFFAPTAFDMLGAVVGAIGSICCGIYFLVWKIKHKKNKVAKVAEK